MQTPIERADMVKAAFRAGGLSYGEAIAQLKPILDEMNEAASAIAKKWGRKHQPFSPMKFLR